MTLKIQNMSDPEPVTVRPRLVKRGGVWNIQLIDKEEKLRRIIGFWYELPPAFDHAVLLAKGYNYEEIS